MFTDLLLGRLRLIHPDDDTGADAEPTVEQAAEVDDDQPTWLETEDIDPDTGELLGTRLQRIDAEGVPIGEPINSTAEQSARFEPAFNRRPRQLRIGVVVPLSTVLGTGDAPAELADRSGFILGELLRQQIAESLAPDS